MKEQQEAKHPAQHSGRRLPLALDRAELAAMLRAPSQTSKTGTRNRAVLAAFMGGGLRLAELCALHPSDVRWDKYLVEVHRGKGHKDRNIPISPETLAFLKAWDAIRPSGSKRFFTTLHGAPLMRRYVQDMVRRMALKAQVHHADKVSPHTLRHSFATLCIEDGMTLPEVQTLLGHANLATTSIYLHVRPAQLAARVAERPPIVPPLRSVSPVAAPAAGAAPVPALVANVAPGQAQRKHGTHATESSTPDAAGAVWAAFFSLPTHQQNDILDRLLRVCIRGERG